MSANHYKTLLNQTLVKLNAATTSAAEWKTVANNRLLLMVAIDGALNSQVYQLLKVGTIFGVSPDDPGMPTAHLGAHSADEITSFILHKIKAAASFTAHLTKEASELQATLSTTLGLALEAKQVDRPILDLKVKDYTALVGDAVTPLRDVFEMINNVSEDSQALEAKEQSSYDEQVDEPADTGDDHPLDEPDGTSYEMSQALNLFRKRT